MQRIRDTLRENCFDIMDIHIPFCRLTMELFCKSIDSQPIGSKNTWKQMRCERSTKMNLIKNTVQVNGLWWREFDVAVCQLQNFDRQEWGRPTGRRWTVRCSRKYEEFQNFRLWINNDGSSKAHASITHTYRDPPKKKNRKNKNNKICYAQVFHFIGSWRLKTNELNERSRD